MKIKINQHTSSPEFKYLKVIHVKEETSNQEKHILQIPYYLKGILMHPDFGCTSLLPNQELIVETENFDFLSNCHLCFSSGNEEIEDMQEIYLCSRQIRKEFINLSPFFWEVCPDYTHPGKKFYYLFTRLEDAVECFFHTPEAVYLNKVSERHIHSNLGNSCVLQKKFELFSYDAPLLMEERNYIEKKIKEYKMRITTNTNSIKLDFEELNASHFEKTNALIEFIQKTFEEQCRKFQTVFCREKTAKHQKQYAARLMPDPYSFHAPPRWFELLRYPEIPESFREKVLSDGSLLLPFPDFCSSWSEEEREFVLNVFLYNYTGFKKDIQNGKWNRNEWHGDGWYNMGITVIS